MAYINLVVQMKKKETEKHTGVGARIGGMGGRDVLHGQIKCEQLPIPPGRTSTEPSYFSFFSHEGRFFF